MRDPHQADASRAAELLDDHLRLAGHQGVADLGLALPAMLIRTRSVAARQLLARAGLGATATLDELLTAARAGNTRWLRRLRRRVHAEPLAGLAQTLALQDLLPGDARDALALYDLIRTALGPAALAPRHQGLHAQLGYLADGADAARTLLRQYPRIRPPIRDALAVDLVNPYLDARVGDEQAWWDAFRALLPVPGPVLDPAADPGTAAFDRLRPGGVDRVDGTHRISVIVTAYQPDEGLLTAVRSIVGQSWRNTEVIVVDDASPVSYAAIFDKCLTLGDRIRLIRLPRNSGTYAARNAGLDASAGEFVTFQDSDDFSHPRRLELQVRPLLADPRLVASTSDALGVTDELALTRTHVRNGRFNPSALLFRRDAVTRRIGYFDPVRKAADSEYIGRIEAAFGAAAVHHLDVGPLALIRLTPHSLSRAEIRPYWLHPARAAYSSAYLNWHERVAAGGAEAYRPRDGGGRPYAVPVHLLARPGRRTPTRGYDVLVVADWRFVAATQATALDELHALHEAGLRVAIVHLESYRRVHRRRLPLAGAVQRMVNTGVVDHVQLADPLEVTLVVVRQPEVLQFATEESGEVRPRRVLVVADRAPARRDGTDPRYLPEQCDQVARRMFGVDPIWCPQDPGIRAALGPLLPADQLTDVDLPHVVDATGWVGDRDAAASPTPVIGTDLCDGDGWPADVEDALRVYRSVRVADVRLRLPARAATAPRLPMSWLVYAADDLDTRGYLHQLDMYLHFPAAGTVETTARGPLAAAAAGCVVLLPERFAASYGDAAVYCAPDQVAATIGRYHDDRALFAAQSRLAQTVVATAHHPRRFVDLIQQLLRGRRSTAPWQRAPEAGAGAAR